MSEEDKQNLSYRKTTTITYKQRGIGVCLEDRLKDLQQIIDEENIGISNTTISLTEGETKIVIDKKEQVEGWWMK